MSDLTPEDEALLQCARDGDLPTPDDHARVKGKLFAQLDDHHHGADHLAVWLPAPLGEQESLIFLDAERFFRPPYVGGRGWVGVRIDRRPDWKLVASLVQQAYREVAPPRLRQAIGAAAPRIPPRRRS